MLPPFIQPRPLRRHLQVKVRHLHTLLSFRCLPLASPHCIHASHDKPRILRNTLANNRPPAESPPLRLSSFIAVMDADIGYVLRVSTSARSQHPLAMSYQRNVLIDHRDGCKNTHGPDAEDFSQPVALRSQKSFLDRLVDHNLPACACPFQGFPSKIVVKRGYAFWETACPELGKGPTRPPAPETPGRFQTKLGDLLLSTTVISFWRHGERFLSSVTSFYATAYDTRELYET